MKKTTFKKIVKECVSECIHEVLFESGVISKVVSEVVQAMPKQTLVESSKKEKEEEPEQNLFSKEVLGDRKEKISQKLQEQKRRLLDGIGKNGYDFGGVDIFEGTMPLSDSQSPVSGPSLSGRDPNDKGLDISGLLKFKDAWKKVGKKSE